MKKMSDLAYYYGLKMRIYPSSQQKKIIDLNGNIARTVYNKMVAIDQELYRLKQIKLPIDSVLLRIDELEKRKQTSYLANHYRYLLNPLIDSQAIADAKQNYRKAWNMFRKVHNAGTPKFHKKGYGLSYQTNGHYKTDDKLSVYTGNLCFLDNKHIKLPKLGIS